MKRSRVRCRIISRLLPAAIALVVASIPAALAQRSPGVPKALAVRSGLDDSLRTTPPKDLELDTAGQRRANALALFIEGARLEENGELEPALAAYQKVLTVDPGEIELASRVASLLTRQDDYPRAIDVLRDAIKAKPDATAPYLQLAYIYARHLQRPEQALKYANQAVELDPENIDGYQRIYEVELASGEPKRAIAALERALKVRSKNPSFWVRLGKLYAAVLFKPGETPKPEELRKVNGIFKQAADHADDDPAILREVADYYAATQQPERAIPVYFQVVKLQPDDATAREKLAASLVATQQREEAAELLQKLIDEQPERYESYELLAQVFDDEAKALQRANEPERAKAQWARAAANYEQSLLINPTNPRTYLRLAEVLIIALREADRAERVLKEARMQFPGAPEFAYYLAIAQREGKRVNESLVTFEEAAAEAQTAAPEMLTARFYFDYGAAAEQAGFYDKAADLFRESIVRDPANAEAYNHLGYMFAEQNMHLDEAEQVVRKALELDPDNGAYLDSLGWVLYRKGRFDEALRELLRAAQSLTKDDPVVFEHIGDTYAKLNRVPQALEFWQKAFALDPANKALVEKIESTRTQMSKSEAAKAPPVQ